MGSFFGSIEVRRTKRTASNNTHLRLGHVRALLCVLLFVQRVAERGAKHPTMRDICAALAKALPDIIGRYKVVVVQRAKRPDTTRDKLNDNAAIPQPPEARKAWVAVGQDGLTYEFRDNGLIFAPNRDTFLGHVNSAIEALRIGGDKGSADSLQRVKNMLIGKLHPSDGSRHADDDPGRFPMLAEPGKWTDKEEDWIQSAMLAGGPVKEEEAKEEEVKEEEVATH